MIETTIRKIVDMGLWFKYCEVTGTNEYYLAEGGDDNRTVTISFLDAEKIGLRIKI